MLQIPHCHIYNHPLYYQGTSALDKACKENDLTKVKQLVLQDKVDVNYNHYDWNLPDYDMCGGNPVYTKMHTSLYTACQQSNYAIASFLIYHGANVHLQQVKTEGSYKAIVSSPLVSACLAKNAAMIRLLLVHGATTKLKYDHATVGECYIWEKHAMDANVITMVEHFIRIPSKAIWNMYQVRKFLDVQICYSLCTK